MVGEVDKRKAELVRRVVRHRRGKICGAKGKLFDEFIANYLANVPPSDLDGHAVPEIYNLIREHWIFAAKLNTGSAVPVDNEFHGRREEPVYLLGGHVERQIGALNVGLNYANINRTDSFIDLGDHTLKGVLPSTGTGPPLMIAVKVSDGSPDDGKGARVLDLPIDGALAAP